MARAMRFGVATLLLLVVSPLAQAAPGREIKSAAELLPPSTLIYLEAARPGDLINLLMDHPLREDVLQSEQARQTLQSKQFKDVLALVNTVEQRAGVKWREAANAIAGNGFAVGVFPAIQSAVVLIHSPDTTVTEKVREAIFSLVRDDARAKGKPDPIETRHYRDLTAWRAGDVRIIPLGSFLAITNHSWLATTVADLFLDGGNTLADDTEFSNARLLAAGNQGEPTAWAFGRLAPVRLLAAGQPWMAANGKSDNPGVELILGGLIDTFKNSPFVTASLRVKEQDVKLEFSSPNDLAWVPSQRKFYFGDKGDGAPAPLVPKNVLLSMSTYRDIAAMWQAAPDLFTEGVAAKMAQTDSGLSAFLGGKGFSADILGALRPQMQVVVTKQDYAAAGVKTPALRFPQGAFIFQIKPGESKTVRKAFRLAFQTLIALGNLDGAPKGRPVLESQSETRGKTDILFATYEQEDEPAEKVKPAESAAPPANAKSAERNKPVSSATQPTTKPSAKDDTYLNFSPALVISEQYLMICSTRQMAEELADLVSKQNDAPRPAMIVDNTLIELSPALSADVVHQNREQLIAQNMLEKGHDRAAAEGQIELLEKLVGFYHHAAIRLTPAEKSVTISLELKRGD
jgi:hypothetical protein